MEISYLCLGVGLAFGALVFTVARLCGFIFQTARTISQDI